MIISSSNRIIKRPEAAGSLAIENYMPSLEELMKNRDLTPREPVFPHYTQEGKKKEEKPPEEASSREEERQLMETAAAVEEEVGRQQEKLLDEWKEEGARLLEEAEEQAARILEEAELQAKQTQARAYEEGRREGYKAGFEEGREKAEGDFREEIQDQLLSFQADVKRALKSVDTAKEACLRAYLDELKDCAVAVGEKVIHISLKSSGEVIKQMIISATEKLKKTAWVKIYIDKYDYDMMMDADARIVEELSRLSDNIKFIVMEKEARGSCIIEMPEEIVDVSVNTQIENIKDILENVRL